MSMGNKINSEVMGWTGVAITVVLASIILLKFKTSNPGNMTCGASYTYNATANNCYLTANSSTTTAIGSVASTTDSFVAALAEPKNWVAIVIIALIGFAILAFYNKKGKQ